MSNPTRLTGKASDFLKVGVEAAGRGDLDTLKYVLKEKPDWCYRVGSHGRTMLWEASYTGRTEIVRYLLDVCEEVDLEARGCYYTPMRVEVSPLCVTVKKKHEAVQDLLLARGAKYDCVSACYLGDLRGVERFIEKTPSILRTEYPQHDPQGRLNLLHYAVMSERAMLVSFLATEGVSVETNPDRLLDLAIYVGHPEILKILFINGLSAKGRQFLRGDIKSDEIARLLVKYGAKLDVDGVGERWPSLVYVCRGDRGGDPNEVKRLLDLGADVNVRNFKQQSAMHCAAKAGFVPALRLLIAHGGDVNATDQDQSTPLHAAVSSTIKDDSKLQETVDLLIRSGADPKLKNKRGLSAIDIVSRKRKHKLRLDS